MTELPIPPDVIIRLREKAELLWADLDKNQLGGFSGINRPFWILETLKEVWLEGRTSND